MTLLPQGEVNKMNQNAWWIKQLKIGIISLWWMRGLYKMVKTQWRNDERRTQSPMSFILPPYSMLKWWKRIPHLDWKSRLTLTSCMRPLTSRKGFWQGKNLWKVESLPRKQEVKQRKVLIYHNSNHMLAKGYWANESSLDWKLESSNGIYARQSKVIVNEKNKHLN